MFNNLIRLFRADDITLNLGSGGKTVATLDVAGVQHEKVIVEFLSAGVPVMTDAANPLPVTDAAAEALLTSIAGEDFATSANQTTGNSSLASIDAKLTNPLPVSGTVNTGLTQPLTDTELRATPVPVSGTITAVTSITNALPAGNNNIGDVDVASLPALAAGTNTIGNVNFAPSTTATLSNVNDSATNVTLLASNSARKVATIFNDSTQILYVKMGATASLTSFTVKIQPEGYYELPQPIYTGIIDGIWAADGSGAARVTEW